MPSEKEQAAFEIVKRLMENGYKALYAGGYVRDMLMAGPDTGDIDIATNARPTEIASLFPQVIGVGEHFGVMIVLKNAMQFEVATFRADIGIKDGRHPRQVEYTDEMQDARRRDFTINGMFFDPLEKRVIDYVSGREDIRQKCIRAIGNPALRFEEDYLRLLRALRFAARFDFSIQEQTWAALKEKAAGIERVSPERIFQEIEKMIIGPNPGKALTLLDESGLLGLVLPEVAATRNVRQPEEFHPEGDVFVHTVKTLSLLEKPSRIVAWSALLHDVGKPSTMTVSDRIRFSNHQRAGAEIAARVLRRLRASGSLIDGVCACIDNHMNFMNVQKMRLSTLKKFLSRPLFEEEMELHRADCLASHGDISNYDFLRQKQREIPIEEAKPLPLVSGKDLIALGLSPGPLFGRIIEEAYDVQLEGKIASKDEAIRWVRERHP
jgi:putative nucleotidyltransferase with HDIG domain